MMSRNSGLKVKCKNANDSAGLTKGKFYEVVDHNPDYVCIYNDNGVAGYYQRRRFAVIVIG